jgi:hypothetical protein
VSAPVIHSEARQLPLASAEEAERADRVFTIEPRALVLASTADVRLIVADGNPSDASAREEGRFLVGLLGAILAIGSVIFLAFALSGGLGGVEGGP